MLIVKGDPVNARAFPTVPINEQFAISSELDATINKGAT